MPHRVSPIAFAILTTVCLSLGCRPEDEIRTYRVATSDAPPRAATPPPAEASQPVVRPAGDPTDRMIGGIFRGPDRAWFFKATGPRATIDTQAEAITSWLSEVRFEDAKPAWSLPDGWKTGKEGGMRLATLLIPAESGETELSVIGLPLVGEWDAQVLDNVNRWRGQLRLDPVDAATLKETARPIGADGVQAVLFDAAGWFESGGMTPPFAGGASRAPMPSPALPRPAAPAELVGEVPEGWTEKPGSAMRKASYAAPGEAEVTAFAFPAAGQMGDELENVNRWRREVGLSTTTAEELQDSREGMRLLETDNGAFFELAGPTETTYAAMATLGDQVWFFKLRGPTAAADAQRDAFREWLASLRLSK